MKKLHFNLPENHIDIRNVFLALPFHLLFRTQQKHLIQHLKSFDSLGTSPCYLEKEFFSCRYAQSVSSVGSLAHLQSFLT